MSETQTLADRVQVLKDAHGAEFTRSVNPLGAVVVVLEFPAGDKISGSGATTAEAVTALEARVAAFMTALGGAA
jgi:hypothetical protein